MLTRLEVDGFKNLLRFEVEFGPFNCIAGPNGVGKSNIFDAIRLLSLLADNTLRDAALNVRGRPETAHERDLFWTDGEERAESFRIAADMIVAPKVFDDMAQEIDVSSTYLRYEVEVGYAEPDLSNGKIGGLFLLSETLHDYTLEEAKERLRFPHTEEFFEAVIRLEETRNSFISTLEAANGQREIIVSPNGTGSLKRIVPADKAPRTIVATAGLWSPPIILAARHEMRSWKLLAMDPKAIRIPDPLTAEPHITTIGGHLHATLYRIATTANGETEPEDVYAGVAFRLSNFIKTWKLSVDVDPIRQLLTTEVKEERFIGGKIPARSLSDGTLRFLTLAVLIEDPAFQNLICIEEPENGIHPSKMEVLVELLKEMPVDATFEPSWEEENPMRQVIIATHSPYLVQLLSEEDLLIAFQPLTKGPSGKSTRRIECWPLSGTWRERKNDEWLSLASILAYLKAPANAIIRWQGISN